MTVLFKLIYRFNIISSKTPTVLSLFRIDKFDSKVYVEMQRNQNIQSSFEKEKWKRQTSIDAAAKLLQSCLTLGNTIDGSPPGSSIPGILQARILEWVAISFSETSTIWFQNLLRSYSNEYSVVLAQG